MRDAIEARSRRASGGFGSRILNWLCLFVAACLYMGIGMAMWTRPDWEEFSQDAVPRGASLMGSWFLEVLLQPWLAYVVFSILAALFVKEFIIRDRPRKIRINLYAALVALPIAFAIAFELSGPARHGVPL